MEVRRDLAWRRRRWRGGGSGAAVAGGVALGPAARMLLLASVLVVTPSPVPAQSPGSAAPVEEIRLMRGDALQVVVWERAELSGQFEIMADGRLAHPLYKDLVVEGRTYDEVRAEVAEFVARFQKNPELIVVPLRRVAVGGAVANPGLVPVDPRSTVLEVLARAGGPLPGAGVTRAYLVRAGERVRIPLWDAPGANPTLLELGARSGEQIVFEAPRSVWSRYVSPVLNVAQPLLWLANLYILIGR